jgi:hypothetical protein
LAVRHQARWIDRVRDTYHTPPETPRDEMWRVISARMADETENPVEPDVIDLGPWMDWKRRPSCAASRRRRTFR